MVFGAGALSLGFLGPLLSEDYGLVFCDLDVKGDLIRLLQKENAYLINLCSDKVSALRVQGVTGFNLSLKEEREEVKKMLGKTEILFTAVGNSGIDETLNFIKDNYGINRKKKLHIFLAENDKNILKRWVGRLGNKVKLHDTIMGRMCRFESVEDNYQPVAPGFPQALVAEDFFGLPVPSDVYREARLKGRAWEVMSEETFEAKSYLKLFAHNGLHAYLSYLGSLRGIKYFYQADPPLLSEGEILLRKEVCPAILKKYGDCLVPAEVHRYCDKLIGRVTNPVFRDTIERGTRGSWDKIGAAERLVGGAKFILNNGFLPKYYCRIIAAGIMLNINLRMSDQLIAKITREHCGIREKKLADLIKKAVKDMEKKYGEETN